MPLASENLLDIYNEALDNDPQYKSSEYSLLAGKEFVVCKEEQDFCQMLLWADQQTGTNIINLMNCKALITTTQLPLD